MAAAEDSYKRRTVYLRLHMMSRRSETEYTAHLHKQRRTKTVSDNEHSSLLCH